MVQRAKKIPEGQLPPYFPRLWTSHSNTLYRLLLFNVCDTPIQFWTWQKITWQDCHKLI